MLRVTKSCIFLILIALTVICAACDKKETEERTWEQEMNELNIMLKELEAQGIDIDTTRLSVYYFVRKPGEGPYAQVGDSCSVSYIGFFSNGRKFEDSRDIHPPNGTWNFVYKPPHAVLGLVDGIGYMNKGSEIELFIPSDRAYGSKGTARVPPFTTLIYRVTMHDLKPAK
jgi:FKBP-type peptidyl-prolyl cis-trans isomerase